MTRPAWVAEMDRGTRSLIVLLAILGIALCSFIWFAERPPLGLPGTIGIDGLVYRVGYNRELMGLLSLAVAVGLLVHPRLPEGSRRRLAFRVAMVMVSIGAVLYFYGSRLPYRHYPWFHDSYHYFLGAKYFDEVGYDGLYGCHVLADATRADRRYLPSDTVTDLAADRQVPVPEAQASADCSAFDVDRWEEFRHDVTVYDLNMDKDVLHDRGYNGSPFHTRIASTLADIGTVSYERILAMTFLDIGLLVVLLATVAWAFGWRIGCLFALFFFVNFADRFNFVGASFLRYLWMACLGTGIAMMKKRRYAAAAVLMSAAAMLNVFPVLFFAGIGVKAVEDLVRRRRLAPHHRTFVIWALLATVLFFGVSLAQRNHIRNYGAFLSEMWRHSGVLTEMRVGFRYDFLFRGEYTRNDDKVPYDEKAEDLRRLRPVYLPIVAAVLVFGVLVARRLDDVAATVLLGVLLLFMVFNTATYYYCVTALLLLLWHDREGTRASTLFPAALFGMTAGIYGLWYLTDNHLKFLNNTAMSAMLTVFLLACLVWFRRDGQRPKVSTGSLPVAGNRRPGSVSPS